MPIFRVVLVKLNGGKYTIEAEIVVDLTLWQATELTDMLNYYNYSTDSLYLVDNNPEVTTWVS